MEQLGPEPRPDHDLRPFDVIGHEESIGSPARGRHGIAVGVDHECLGRVAGADAPDISDVVVQRGPNGMAPVAGRDGPLEATTAQMAAEHATALPMRSAVTNIKRVADITVQYEQQYAGNRCLPQFGRPDA